MPPWLTKTRLSYGVPRVTARCRVSSHVSRHARCLSAVPAGETVEVRCGSSGSISVRLHNIKKHTASAPLIVYLPPFQQNGAPPPPLPRPLHDHPVAVINYRWAGSTPLPLPALTAKTPTGGADEADPIAVTRWPTPLHDTLFGYSWLVEHLAPEGNARRDVLVYGSQLGATLAASLALTESHSHQRVAVRGVVALDGIYDWTMFLPDHRINQPTVTKAGRVVPAPELAEGSALAFYKRQLPVLFRDPAGLFDPFASPCLFFRTPGMLVPRSFGGSAIMEGMVDSLAAISEDGGGGGGLMGEAPTPSRRSALVFPPRQSTLKIPETLLLHDSEPVSLQIGDDTEAIVSGDSKTPARKTRASKTVRTAAQRLATGNAAGRAKAKGNTFGLQAAELAGLMRRSIDKVELKERRMWDDEFGDFEAEAERRVRVVHCGVADDSGELGRQGEEVLYEWLRQRVSQ